MRIFSWLHKTEFVLIMSALALFNKNKILLDCETFFWQSLLYCQTFTTFITLICLVSRCENLFSSLREEYLRNNFAHSKDLNARTTGTSDARQTIGKSLYEKISHRVLMKIGFGLISQLCTTSLSLFFVVCMLLIRLRYQSDDFAKMKNTSSFVRVRPIVSSYKLWMKSIESSFSPFYIFLSVARCGCCCLFVSDEIES